MKDKELLEKVQKARNMIEHIDEAVTNNLARSEYGSEAFKQNQRRSNALLKVIRAMEELKYEL